MNWNSLASPGLSTGRPPPPPPLPFPPAAFTGGSPLPSPQQRQRQLQEPVSEHLALCRRAPLTAATADLMAALRPAAGHGAASRPRSGLSCRAVLSALHEYVTLGTLRLGEQQDVLEALEVSVPERVVCALCVGGGGSRTCWMRSRCVCLSGLRVRCVCGEGGAGRAQYA